MRAVSPEVRAKVIELVRNGHTRVEAARICGISDSSAAQFCREAGIPIRSNNPKPTPTLAALITVMQETPKPSKQYRRDPYAILWPLPRTDGLSAQWMYI